MNTSFIRFLLCDDDTTNLLRTGHPDTPLLGGLPPTTNLDGPPTAMTGVEQPEKPDETMTPDNRMPPAEPWNSFVFPPVPG